MISIETSHYNHNLSAPHSTREPTWSWWWRKACDSPFFATPTHLRLRSDPLPGKLRMIGIEPHRNLSVPHSAREPTWPQP